MTRTVVVLPFKLTWAFFTAFIALLFNGLQLLFGFMMNLLTSTERFLAGYVHNVSLVRLKARCTWSRKIMERLVEYNSKCEYEQRGMHPETPPVDEYQFLIEISSIATSKMETPLLIAAKNGVMELVEKILMIWPDAIFDMSTEKKNIVMLAAENRRVHLYKWLYNWDWATTKTILGDMDEDGNSVLHMAAKLDEDQRPWGSKGSAMQMCHEVQWYKFVKHMMPPGFFVRYNKDGKTPGQIFRETHQKLIDEARDMLTTYSNLASLVSALVATVAFPASTTVPGGLKQDKGSPILIDEPIFITSAVSSLIALWFSLIALVIFMIIPKSSFRKRDFHKDLPAKVRMGSISLFYSILFMVVSFCAGQYFVLKDKFKNGYIPIYAIFCLPLLVFISTQFSFNLEEPWHALLTQSQLLDFERERI